MAEQLRTMLQAAERLCVSKDTIRRLGLQGDLRLVRIGGRVLVPESEIERACEFGVGGRAKYRKRSAIPAARTQGTELADGN